MTNLVLAATLSLLAPQTDGFDRFSFCRENPLLEYSLQCFDLDVEGKGVFSFTPQGAETVKVPFEFSVNGVGRFLELLRETDYLVEGDRYESGRRVANMGIKTMVAEGSWGRREAVFNYSTMDEAADLSTFFERLIVQEMLLFDMDIALQFDRLGVPERLELIEREIRSDRLPDPGRVIPMLERVASDNRLVNFARTNATRLKEELEESIAATN